MTVHNFNTDHTPQNLPSKKLVYKNTRSVCYTAPLELLFPRSGYSSSFLNKNISFIDYTMYKSNILTQSPSNQKYDRTIFSFYKSYNLYESTGFFTINNTTYLIPTLNLYKDRVNKKATRTTNSEQLKLCFSPKLLLIGLYKIIRQRRRFFNKKKYIKMLRSSKRSFQKILNLFLLNRDSNLAQIETNIKHSYVNFINVFFKKLKQNLNSRFFRGFKTSQRLIGTRNNINSNFTSMTYGNKLSTNYYFFLKKNNSTPTLSGFFNPQNTVIFGKIPFNSLYILLTRTSFFIKFFLYTAGLRSVISLLDIKYNNTVKLHKTLNHNGVTNLIPSHCFRFFFFKKSKNIFKGNLFQPRVEP